MPEIVQKPLQKSNSTNILTKSSKMPPISGIDLPFVIKSPFYGGRSINTERNIIPRTHKLPKTISNSANSQAESKIKYKIQ